MVEDRRWVILAGGSGGIGVGIAQRLRSDGFMVSVLDQNAPPAGICDHFVRIDLSDPESSANTVSGLLDEIPAVNLVYATGVLEQADLGSVDISRSNKFYAVNVVSFVALAKAMLPKMKELGYGRLVAIGSSAIKGKSERATYAGTKGALQGVIRSLSLELASINITANLVSPGPIRTAMFESAYPPGSAEEQEFLSSLPARRVGAPQDIANAVSYFLDQRSGFVTGQNLYVCGGQSLGWR